MTTRKVEVRGHWEPYWKLPACFLPGVLVTLWIIDRLGRKKTMALCFVIFSLCSLLLFICVGRWVVKPSLSGHQAHFSGHSQWLSGSVSYGLHSWWSSKRLLPSPSLRLRLLTTRSGASDGVRGGRALWFRFYPNTVTFRLLTLSTSESMHTALYVWIKSIPLFNGNTSRS